MALSTTCNLGFVILAGCAGLALPNSDLCVADPARGRLICYNLAQDYMVQGTRLVLKPGAQAHMRKLGGPMDVDRWACSDPQSFAALKAWLQATSDARANCQ